jgi:hypothetical protein
MSVCALASWKLTHSSKKRPDAAGVMGASADQKITASMRQLVYGYPADEGRTCLCKRVPCV